jgi:hypothetical protein
MSRKKLQKYLPVLIGVVIGVGIVFLNKSKISRDYNRTMSIVDKNGVLSTGTIEKIETGSRFTTANILFYYFFNGKIYFNRDYKFPNKVHSGEALIIKIDTTNPARSYIVNTYR